MEYRPLNRITASDRQKLEAFSGEGQREENKIKIIPKDVNVNVSDQPAASVFMNNTTNNNGSVGRLQNIYEISGKDEHLGSTEYKQTNVHVQSMVDLNAYKKNPVLLSRKVSHLSRDNLEGLSKVYPPIPVTSNKIHYGSNSTTTLSTTSSEADPSDSTSVDSLSDHFKSKVKVDTDKRRKDERQKSIVKSAHISNEYVRLRELLDAMSPEQLLEEIKVKLDKKDSKAIVALSVLLPRKHFPPVDHLHCIRCHKKFRPSENTNCIMKHPTSKVVKISQDKNGADFRCLSCSTTFRLNQMYFYNEDVNSYLSGFCYSEKHTTNPGEVSYAGAMKTCEENGCVEFYV